MTSRLSALAGPKALKTPGSPEWCWQTVQVLREQMRHVSEQWDLADNALRQLREAKAWEKIPPDHPYGSLNAMLKAEVGLTAAAVRNRIREASERARALNGKTVRKAKGGPLSREDKANLDIVKVSDAGAGNSADYLTRRIARDHPDIFERLQAGEYRSVRAAALEAGIIHRTQSVRVDNPVAVARTLRKHMSPEDLALLAKLITED